MICQLGYDIENETVIFKNSQLQSGDLLEVLIPNPENGELIWTSAQIVWETRPGQRWRLVSGDLKIDSVLETCNPVGLFARK